MPSLPLIILHGWSDNAQSFKPLADWLRAHGFRVVDVWLGDYLSMNDEITLTDLGYAFQLALQKNGIAQTRHSFDLIVHSTGGLVAREYLRQVCIDPATGQRDPVRTPIQHLCMLAPANFGSPLAKLGKSMLGRLFKGWSWNHFGESGKHVLEALDLASAYSFDLALDDLFDPAFRVLAPENTITTVMVGTVPYPDALRSSIHEDGSDGTVRVATANLEASYFEVDFLSATEPPLLTARPRNVSEIAFALFHRNHATITQPGAPTQQEEWRRTLLDALTLPPAQYILHVQRCTELTANTRREGLQSAHPKWYHAYQHIALRVHDQHGAPIDDYMIEFYQEPRDEHDAVFKKINTDILEKVTRNDLAPHYRSFFFDTTDLCAFLKANPDTVVEMSICAAHPSRRIRFVNPERGVEVFSLGDGRFIQPDQPILVDITIHREPNVSTDLNDRDNVFKLRPA